MKPQEAKELVEQCGLNIEGIKRIECESVIISALEKQIPKKPIKQIWINDEKRKGDVRLATKDDVLTKDNHGIINLCPNCKQWVMTYKYLSPPKDKDYYCKCCGQALDWGDDNV